MRTFFLVLILFIIIFIFGILTIGCDNMIIKKEFMNHADSNDKPVIPGIRTPFEYIQEQSKIRNIQNRAMEKKTSASAEELRKLENQNKIKQFQNPSGQN